VTDTERIAALEAQVAELRRTVALLVSKARHTR
jgi:hypothetical protein